MSKKMRLVYLLLTFILLISILFIYRANPFLFTHKTTSLPTVIIAPDPLFSVDKARQVLSDNGFEYYPIKEQFCHSPCKSYRIVEYDTIVQSYDDETMAFGIRFVRESEINGFNQAAILFKILKPLYPRDVLFWIIDNMGTDTVEEAVISRYYLRVAVISIPGGSGLSIVITPVKNVPKDSNN